MNCVCAVVFHVSCCVSWPQRGTGCSECLHCVQWWPLASDVGGTEGNEEMAKLASPTASSLMRGFGGHWKKPGLCKSRGKGFRQMTSPLP